MLRVATENKKHKPKAILALEIIETGETTEIMTMRKSHKPSEFIPASQIEALINHHFPSAELVLLYSEIHRIYKIKIRDLLVGPIKNWSYNRPPDGARCPDIARYIYNSKRPMDTMLYLSFDNLKDVFEVLDGIHRLTALKLIKEENSKPLDLLTCGEFGSNNDANWLYDQYLLVNIRFNAGLGELIEVFQSLNKSQVVPDLYIKDSSKEKREIIDAIANEWYVKYKRHFSSSVNPHIGNTNRNRFVDLLDKVYDKHKIDESSANNLRQLLEEANRKIGENIPSKVSVDTRLKCKESECYLFLYKNDVLLDFI
jgi:hypothetical protein